MQDAGGSFYVVSEAQLEDKDSQKVKRTGRKHEKAEADAHGEDFGEYCSGDRSAAVDAPRPWDDAWSALDEHAKA